VPVEIHWQVRQCGAMHWLTGVTRDISEPRMPSYDSLTGLPNRTLFFLNLGQPIELAQDAGASIGLLVIGLDRFRIINESLGAELGDQLLRQFSDRLVQCVPLRDTVGRLGGDEFALFLHLAEGQRSALGVASQVRETLRATRTPWSNTPTQWPHQRCRSAAWVIDEACRQIADWAGATVGEVRVAINVSSSQFVEGDLEAEIRRALRRHLCDQFQGFHFSGALALRKLLAQDHYRILSARSSEQRLAHMNGTQFLSQVKQMHPQTFRMILSADIEQAALLDAINRGAIDRFYTKPWNDAELRDKIRLAFQHSWRPVKGNVRQAARM
jgi:diguanylate cyclase (GGDEF)-like protein